MSKIKAIDPKIVVNGNIDKPYYSIEYYDTADNKWHIGYGSYELKNVIEWLKTDFDVIKADVAPVRHGHWYMRGGRACCSKCNVKSLWGSDWDGCENHEREFVSAKSNYCPNCGAKMKE